MGKTVNMIFLPPLLIKKKIFKRLISQPTEQFEIVGITANGLVPNEYKLPWFEKHNNPFIKEKAVYQRILVQQKEIKPTIRQKNLDEYTPEQFELVGASQRGCHDENLELKKYDDYLEVRQNGTQTGSSGNKANGNPIVAKNDGTHNYFINSDGHVVQSCYSRIFIRQKKAQ